MYPMLSVIQRLVFFSRDNLNFYGYDTDIRFEI